MDRFKHQEQTILWTSICISNGCEIKCKWVKKAGHLFHLLARRNWIILTRFWVIRKTSKYVGSRRVLEMLLWSSLCRLLFLKTVSGTNWVFSCQYAIQLYYFIGQTITPERTENQIQGAKMLSENNFNVLPWLIHSLTRLIHMLTHAHTQRHINQISANGPVGPLSRQKVLCHVLWLLGLFFTVSPSLSLCLSHL